jgi:uncharacterized protein (DUF1778 family)
MSSQKEVIETTDQLVRLSAAFDTLAGRRVFQLDEVQWAAFIAALDMPSGDNRRLRKLLLQKAPWE